ncbi:MAG: glycosyltransferase family 2 protein [Candidatus Acidiferrales bacterium]
MARPFISVALCTYNGARYLQTQLESIASQSQPPDELIICDDGPTDHTCEIIESFSEKRKGLVRFQRNLRRLGYTKNFEQAISLCKGDIIFLSDQDDVWLPKKMEKVNQVFAEEESCGLVAVDATVTDEELRPKGTTLLRSRAGVLPDRRSFAHLYAQSFKYGCTLAFRASLRKILLPISSHWGHDNWICFISSIFSKVVVIEEPLMLYRRHAASSGVNASLDLDKWAELWNAYKKSKLHDYQADWEQWRAMYSHLLPIFASGATAAPLCTSLWAHASAESLIKARLDFSERRLELAGKPRPTRIWPAILFLITGDYHEYVCGWRSLARDLLTT